MEIWKTAAYADGKPIHSLWKRTGLSHRSANRFPTATPEQAVYAHSHNACCCEYPSPSLPIRHKKERETEIKKSGSTALGQTEKLYSRFVFMECVRNRTFFPSYRQGHSRKENHKGSLWKSRYSRLFCRFFTFIPAVFGAFGKIVGTGNQNHPETLLAIMGAAKTDLVILPPAVFPQEEGPFQTPFLAPAHRSPCSGASRPERFTSGGLRSAHSRFASSSRSRMEGFTTASSRRPLLITPSIMP